MRKVFLTVAALFTFTLQAKVELTFRFIDGQNYYDFLGVNPKAKRQEILAAYLKLSDTYAPTGPNGGHEAMYRMVREAYQSLEPPNVRAYYNQWLKEVTETKDAPTNRSERQNDLRAEVLEIIFERILETAQTTPSQDLAELAKLQIVSYQRLMPDGFISIEELHRLMTHYVLNEHLSYQKFTAAQVALAGGVVSLLKDRAHGNSANDNEKARFYLRSLRRRLRSHHNELADAQRIDFLLQVEKLIDGLEESFSLNCENALLKKPAS